MKRVPVKWEASGYFLISAIFHYLGPSFAVLLFAHVGPLGVAWLRIISAAVVLSAWRRPWRAWRTASAAQQRLYVALGVVLGTMNSMFYLAIDRLDLATVGAIEFLGVIAVAAIGVRTRRNLLALAITVAGVGVLTQLSITSEPLGLLFSLLNAAGFAAYLVLGHRIANVAPTGAATAKPRWAGVDQLAVSMLIAAIATSITGLRSAGAVLTNPVWLLWGIGVGVCSSVIPYVADQLAMAKLGRATFALMMALLPASATAIGAIVLQQTPTTAEITGIALVILGIVVHTDTATRPSAAGPPPTHAPGGEQ